MSAAGDERFLLPHERVLHEARPRRGPSFVSTGDAIFYFNWLVFVGFVGAIWVYSLKRPLFFGWDPATWDPINLIPAGVLLFVVGLILYQVASWSARRYLLTDKRLIQIDGVVWRTARAWDRTGEERIEKTLDGRIRLQGFGEEQPIHLPGLDDSDLDALKRVLSDPGSG